jgi:hypothetical protein
VRGPCRRESVRLNGSFAARSNGDRPDPARDKPGSGHWGPPSRTHEQSCYRGATKPRRTTPNPEQLASLEILIRRRSWLLRVALRRVLERIRNQRQYIASRPDGGE